jgi:hypothetical protein
MALFAFDNNNTSPVSDLLQFSHRQKTASELNAAILIAQSQDKGNALFLFNLPGRLKYPFCIDPKLPKLLKLLIFVQNQLEEKVSYPKITNFVNGFLDDEAIKEADRSVPGISEIATSTSGQTQMQPTR